MTEMCQVTDKDIVMFGQSSLQKAGRNGICYLYPKVAELKVDHSMNGGSTQPA